LEGTACNPGISQVWCCGGHLNVGKVLLLATAVHWIVALCHHNRGCVNGVAALVSLQLLL
jgi:hypothetical protein